MGGSTLYDDRKPEQFPSERRRDDVGYTMEEVARHCKVDDGWIVVKSFVYDITNFAKHHPGWTVSAGQTSTVLAIQRNLGKECTDEFMMIHSKSAIKQLDDYMIGYLIDSVPRFGTFVDLDFCVPQILCFFNTVQDALRLHAVSRRCAQAITGQLCNPNAANEALWVQLRLHCCRPLPAWSPDSESFSGVPLKQTALLLGPRLWGTGRVVTTQAEIVLTSYRALGCFSFGVVPELAYHEDPQESRHLSYTFDGLGRLWVPGASNRKQRKLLYGRRLVENDRLGLLIQTTRGQGRRVKCSFLVNGHNLGIAFTVDADCAYAAVLYFDPMIDPTAIQVALPQHVCTAEHQGRGLEGRGPEGLMFNKYGPFPTTWLRIPVDDDAIQQLTLDAVKIKLAKHLTSLGPNAVSAEQVEVLIDGEFATDSTLPLRSVIHYRNGVHLESLQWHLTYLTS